MSHAIIVVPDIILPIFTLSHSYPHTLTHLNR